MLLLWWKALRCVLAALRAALAKRLRPSGVLAGVATDLLRSHAELVAENALLRQQLLVLRRCRKRPPLTPVDRARLVLLCALSRTWKSALLLVRPETVLRWHRRGFRWFWRFKSRRGPPKPRLAPDLIALIRTMAADNSLWGAERIRGELLKLGHRVSKRTIQKYMRSARPRPPAGQSWTTFLHNHAPHMWACDFLQTYDIFFRPLFALVFVCLGTREVMHVGVTRHPTSAWVAQQLREATPFGAAPRFLVRDNDNKYGAALDRVARVSGIRVLRTPYRAPNANAICERFLGTLRRECLDHTLLLGVGHLLRVAREYLRYFNAARPHQGIHQRIPARSTAPQYCDPRCIEAIPVLGGLHHDYRALISVCG